MRLTRLMITALVTSAAIAFAVAFFRPRSTAETDVTLQLSDGRELQR